MKVFVASKNPIKCEAALLAVKLMFPESNAQVMGFSVESGISDQPMNNDETRQGACNRVENLMTAEPGGDLYIGLEGGCAETYDVLGLPQLEAFAWMVVSDGQGKWGESRTASFHLPQAVAELVRQGVELGKADDQVFGMQNSKQSQGACGLLTGGVLNRAAYYAPAVILALVPFKNPNLY